MTILKWRTLAPGMLLYMLPEFLSNWMIKAEFIVMKACWQWGLQFCKTHFSRIIIKGLIIAAAAVEWCCRLQQPAQWWVLSAAGVHVLSTQVLPQLRMLLCILGGCHPNGLWWDDWWAQPRGDQPQTLYIPLVGLEAESQVLAALPPHPPHPFPLPAAWEIKRPFNRCLRQTHFDDWWQKHNKNM